MPYTKELDTSVVYTEFYKYPMNDRKSVDLQIKTTAFRRLSFLLFCFGCLVLSDLAACAKLLLLALVSSLLALCACDDIDDHLAAVHAGLRINAMSQVRIALLVGRHTGG